MCIASQSFPYDTASPLRCPPIGCVSLFRSRFWRGPTRRPTEGKEGAVNPKDKTQTVPKLSSFPLLFVAA